jgi:hypothetical protein
MKGKKKAVWGLILAAGLLSSAAARAEVSIGGGIEGYIPSARQRVSILPEAPAVSADKAAPAVQQAPDAKAAVAVPVAAEKKVSERQAVKKVKKARARSGKGKIVSGTPVAPKAAAPVSVS